MTTLSLVLGAISLGDFSGEAAVLLTLITLLITKELIEARPDSVVAEGAGRTFYLATAPLVLLFAAIVAVRFVS